MTYFGQTETYVRHPDGGQVRMPAAHLIGLQKRHPHASAQEIAVAALSAKGHNSSIELHTPLAEPPVAHVPLSEVVQLDGQATPPAQ